MKAPDWLKGWSLIQVNIDLSGLKSVKLLSDNNIGTGTKLERDSQQRTLVVRVNKGELKKSPEELEAVKELIRLSVANEGGIIEEDTEKLIEDVSGFRKNDKNIRFIDELKLKIPKKDLPIWEAALYIRSVHVRGVSVDTLIKNLKLRYGDRGNNIAKLCTAGYLEDIILPIYDELSNSPDFNVEGFNSRYEIIVTKYPFAVFVAHATPDDEVLKEIRTKIEYNKTYGISTLNIHTIGKDNKNKVLSILANDEIKQHFSREPKIITDGNILQAVIYF